MLDNPNSVKPTFGLLINGREFVFVKLTQQEQPRYIHSYALSIERDSELQQVTSILKRLREVIV